MSRLNGKTVFISGASRGIGRAIALACAKQGANLIITGKSDEPHPKLSGTIHTVAEEVRQAGGQALAVKMDVRKESQVKEAFDAAVAQFGGIDVLVNNASAISLISAEQTKLTRYDLMHSINVRGSLACSKAAIPYLKQSDIGHIITLSPPLNLEPHWLGPHIPYTMTKYGMTLLTLGLAEELREHGVSASCLWPQTTIATAAIEFALDPALMKRSRTPEIMADAAMAILACDDLSLSGQAHIDEALLRAQGQTDFEQYRVDPDAPLMRDLFLDE
ncbi:SDR family oxidoreductase [Paraferrimonas sedimenticola]|uniref:Short chain dehydrogenase n=1 Tax=Paraferrimonas sedimenticola TaxID=375674 RepID=A0AA37RRJ6_9GAMM|nr:NAD(P)-dependent oxidoreductase [Paraferrimonas sedimenticola]GLP95108.1 short chain dehydrogenase [Paraferrimonas sedimenticola]